ncbi:hypothetical protein [Candidatus Reidiella endopervernicosa]|uniref:Uncharacterized protein n=1 Tax=Candidatus Reidiella endopervernicosa TaxID=2738883 RepID=A0A6N0HU11_9GAMM|nr:hypothetical protein [Candidatus Reidiella endopervernicosa]QKQ25898.1 hypothetical protein HUE57_06085 [Candidatus Reidiella endopervernicosa]
MRKFVLGIKPKQTATNLTRPFSHAAPTRCVRCVITSSRPTNSSLTPPT